MLKFLLQHYAARQVLNRVLYRFVAKRRIRRRRAAALALKEFLTLCRHRRRNGNAAGA